MNITIQTNKPIAYDSPDHIDPFGALHNNSTNSKFNERLYRLFNGKINVTDWGCAGGGFIKECLDDGHIGVGIEGSDCRKVRQLPEWNTIPNNLFTCDISEPFQILFDNEPAQFDVITLWEVMEHILENKLNNLFDNMKRHLKDKGLIIMSINVASESHKAQMNPNDYGPGKHHQNIQSIEWWDELFFNSGFIIKENLRLYFKPEWIRGPGYSCDPYATEERYKNINLPAIEQWATINRVLTI